MTPVDVWIDDANREIMGWVEKKHKTKKKVKS